MSTRMKPATTEGVDARAEELARGISARGKKRREDDDRPESGPRTGGDDSDEREVQLDDEDDDEDDDESEGEERPSRKERRAARGRDRERELLELRERTAKMEGELQALRMRPVVAQPAPSTKEDDPDERALRDIVTRGKALTLRGQQLGGRKDAAGNVVGMTQDEADKYEQEWLELEQEKADVLHRRSVRRAGGGQQQMTPQDVARAHVAADYPEIFADRRLVMLAQAKTTEMIANGRPDDMVTIRAALQFVRDTHVQKKREPSPERKSRYAGVARGGGGGSDEARPRSVTLSAKQQAMAEARFRKLKPAEAHKRWAKEVLFKRA